MAKYRVNYTVKGDGSFPSDMLRRDQSTFAEPEDKKWSEMFGVRELMLTTVFDSLADMRWQTKKKLCPNAERWKSFGWEVTEVYEAVKLPPS